MSIIFVDTLKALRLTWGMSSKLFQLLWVTFVAWFLTIVVSFFIPPIIVAGMPALLWFWVLAFGGWLMIALKLTKGI